MERLKVEIGDVDHMIAADYHPIANLEYVEGDETVCKTCPFLKHEGEVNIGSVSTAMCPGIEGGSARIQGRMTMFTYTAPKLYSELTKIRKVWARRSMNSDFKNALRSVAPCLND